MKKLKKGERGFTLIELLITILLAGIVTAAVTGTTLYVLNVNAGTANRMTAVRQVRNVGFWISPDVQMAQCVEPDVSPGFPLTLTWTDLATNDTHKVIYTLEDMSGGLNRLKREHNIYIDSELDSTTTTIVAEYIDPAETSCVWNCTCDCFWECDWDYAWLTFEVTATVGGQNETREYKVKPRPGSQ